MPPVILRPAVPIETLVITAPPDQSVVSPGGGSVAVSWPAYGVSGGATVTGGRPPYTVTYSPTNGSSFAVGTTAVTASVEDIDGRTDSDSFDVLVETPDPPPGPDPLLINDPDNVIVLSLDGNPVVATWSAATATGGTQTYSYTYKENGVAKTSGVSTFAVGVHTLIAEVIDSGDPVQTDSDSFTITVNEASSGDIAELREDPLPGILDLPALRTRLLNASYPERAYLQSLITSMSTKLATAALAIGNPYTNNLNPSARSRNATIWYGAANAAFIAKLDPAVLRTAGLTTPAFTTANSRVLSSTYTAAELAVVAHDLLTVYTLTNKNASYTSLSVVDTIAAGRVTGLYDSPQHGFSAGAEEVYYPLAMAYGYGRSNWDSTQKLAVASKVLTAFTTPTYASSGALYSPADSTKNFATTTEQTWWLGNQTGHHWVARPLMYLVMLNDLEFGSSEEKLAVWSKVQPWMERIAYEAHVYGGNGYHHQEALIQYGTDTWTRVLALVALSRSIYVSGDPWTQCDDVLRGVPHSLAFWRNENERGAYETAPRMHHQASAGKMIPDGPQLLTCARTALLASGFTDDAAAAQWVLDDLGQEPPSDYTTGQWLNAILRFGLLQPRGELIGTDPPATWRREASGGGLVFLGDPEEHDTPTVIIADAPYDYESQHGDNFACSFGIMCGGELAAFRGAEVKSGAFEVLGAKALMSNSVRLRNSSNTQYTPRANTLAAYTPPYNRSIVTTQEHIRAGFSDYEFVQTDWSEAYDNASAGVTGGKRFYVRLPSIGVLMVADVVEGVSASDNLVNWIWVTAVPTWIGGTVTTRPTMTTVNGFVFWRESSDATGWEITNDSTTDIAAVNLQVNAQTRTHAKMYVTPLLPVTGRSLHARGGSDWTIPASPIFKQYQLSDDTGNTAAITKPTTTEQRTTDSQRDHVWGRLETRGTGTNQTFLTVFQFGHSNPGDTYYVGTRVAATLIDGSDVHVMHYPGSAPHAVAFPKTIASVGVDKTYSFIVPHALGNLKVLLTGLPVSSSVGVSGTGGAGSVTLTVSASGAFTSTAFGTLWLTVTAGGAVS